MYWVEPCGATACTGLFLSPLPSTLLITVFWWHPLNLLCLGLLDVIHSLGQDAPNQVYSPYPDLLLLQRVHLRGSLSPSLPHLDQRYCHSLLGSLCLCSSAVPIPLCFPHPSLFPISAKPSTWALLMWLSRCISLWGTCTPQTKSTGAPAGLMTEIGLLIIIIFLKIRENLIFWVDWDFLNISSRKCCPYLLSTGYVWSMC